MNFLECEHLCEQKNECYARYRNREPALCVVQRKGKKMGQSQKKLCSIPGCNREATLPNGHCGPCQAEIMNKARKKKGEGKAMEVVEKQAEKQPEKKKCRISNCKGEVKNINGYCDSCNAKHLARGSRAHKSLSFTGYEDLQAKIEAEAKKEIRSFEGQVIYILKRWMERSEENSASQALPI